MNSSYEYPPEDLDRAPAAPTPIARVPLIDLRGEQTEILSQIDEACRDLGFFNVVGHGIDAEQMAAAVSIARAYFKRSASAKRRELRSRHNPWGYYDRELTKERRDRKEIFDIGPDAISQGRKRSPFEGTTPWPHDFPQFGHQMRSWSKLCASISARLAALIGQALVSGSSAIERAFLPEHTSFLRLNNYPLTDPLGPEARDLADLGIHHHTDAGALTVLLQDEVRGLQVFAEGLWHDVDPVRGALTINIGDMVQIWSNDEYVAPLHRVLAMEKAQRTSLAYFFNPSYRAIVQPLVGHPKYRPVSWAEFRRRRAEGDFARYGTEVQISDWAIDHQRD